MHIRGAFRMNKKTYFEHLSQISESFVMMNGGVPSDMMMRRNRK